MGMGDPRDYEWKTIIFRKCDWCYGSGETYINGKTAKCSCENGTETREVTLKELVEILKNNYLLP